MKSSALGKNVSDEIPKIVCRLPIQTFRPLWTSKSHATDVPASMARRTLSLDRASSLAAVLRSSTRAARTMKGSAAKTKKDCRDNMPLSDPWSAKGPRAWTAPQIVRKETRTAELLIPIDPKRNAAHNRKGTRE